ncbi:hypothetical protein HOLleu_45125 [Holothuria leucospilota]|uniref:Uncharacterized protein n=1 Tax=Holothuria leucospilota TaxID=206669 RepID=A0A9Q0Y9S0_HOLLE|nr:hypothetical protein HOLleu_45125 [Holothuria leucospilota]
MSIFKSQEMGRCVRAGSLLILKFRENQENEFFSGQSKLREFEKSTIKRKIGEFHWCKIKSYVSYILFHMSKLVMGQNIYSGIFENSLGKVKEFCSHENVEHWRKGKGSLVEVIEVSGRWSLWMGSGYR